VVAKNYYIALGSNLGHRAANLDAARAAIAQLGEITAFSPVFETTPEGPSSAPYLNAALALTSDLDAPPLLASLHDIEASLGRVRTERWGARTIDLDLLLAGDRVFTEPALTVPHPRLHERGFVLAPLVCIAAAEVVPTLQRTVAELYAAWKRADGRGVALANDPGVPPPLASDLQRL
jgi:2-amino-4-hydroxy-6-hydroxymethyldihydropteridine diphosphokinase